MSPKHFAYKATGVACNGTNSGEASAPFEDLWNLPESSYLLSVLRSQDLSAVESENVLPHVVPDAEEEQPQRRSTIPRVRHNSFLIKPRVISSHSAKSKLKNSLTRGLCRPLPVPPRLPRVRAGQLVGTNVENTQQTQFDLTR